MAFTSGSQRLVVGQKVLELRADRGVMNHVEAFMKQIAKRLTEESKYTDNPLTED